jgi:hypothetical protein
MIFEDVINLFLQNGEILLYRIITGETMTRKKCEFFEGCSIYVKHGDSLCNFINCKEKHNPVKTAPYPTNMSENAVAKRVTDNEKIILV